MRILGFLILLLVMVGQVHAQPDQTIQLALDTITVEANVPDGWTLLSDSEINQIEARSSDSFYVGGSDLQRAVLRLENPSHLVYGTLPEEDRIGTLLEVIQAGLPTTSDFPPLRMSQVERFTWGGFPAALFLAYSASDTARPAYYAQWYGIELGQETVLILQLATTLPSDLPPSEATLQTLTAIRASLRINGDVLPDASAKFALDTVENPIPPLIPVASMRLRNGLEVRLPAPENWFRQDVTQQAANPAQYFFEDDPRSFDPGEEPTGGVIMVNLIASSLIEDRIGEMPAAGAIALRYAAYLQQNAAPGLSDVTLEAFQWGDYPAVRLTAHYPAPIALHSDGTVQALVLIEAEDSLILITLYAPESRWTELTPLWHNLLGGLLMNGHALPAYPVPEDAP